MLQLKDALYRGIICKQCVPVAQWIERRFPKPCVGCSNRLWDTKFKALYLLDFRAYQGFFYFKNILIFKMFIALNCPIRCDTLIKNHHEIMLV